MMQFYKVGEKVQCKSNYVVPEREQKRDDFRWADAAFSFVVFIVYLDWIHDGLRRYNLRACTRYI